MLNQYLVGKLFAGKELAASLSLIPIGIGVGFIGMSWIDDTSKNIDGGIYVCNTGIGFLASSLLFLSPITTFFIVIATVLVAGKVSESTCP